MTKRTWKYCLRIARETRKKKPMTEPELTDAKKQCLVNDINEVMRIKE